VGQFDKTLRGSEQHQSKSFSNPLKLVTFCRIGQKMPQLGIVLREYRINLLSRRARVDKETGEMQRSSPQKIGNSDAGYH
jgi:hypothetical protein